MVFTKFRFSKFPASLFHHSHSRSWEHEDGPSLLMRSRMKANNVPHLEPQVPMSCPSSGWPTGLSHRLQVDVWDAAGNGFNSHCSPPDAGQRSVIFRYCFCCFCFLKSVTLVAREPIDCTCWSSRWLNLEVVCFHIALKWRKRKGNWLEDWTPVEFKCSLKPRCLLNHLTSACDGFHFLLPTSCKFLFLTHSRRCCVWIITMLERHLFSRRFSGRCLPCLDRASHGGVSHLPAPTLAGMEFAWTGPLIGGQGLFTEWPLRSKGLSSASTPCWPSEAGAHTLPGSTQGPATSRLFLLRSYTWATVPCLSLPSAGTRQTPDF